jgi:hypothetical protein
MLSTNSLLLQPDKVKVGLEGTADEDAEDERCAELQGEAK